MTPLLLEIQAAAARVHAKHMADIAKIKAQTARERSRAKERIEAADARAANKFLRRVSALQAENEQLRKVLDNVAYVLFECAVPSPNVTGARERMADAVALVDGFSQRKKR